MASRLCDIVSITVVVMQNYYYEQDARGRVLPVVSLMFVTFFYIRVSSTGLTLFPVRSVS